MSIRKPLAIAMILSIVLAALTAGCSSISATPTTRAGSTAASTAAASPAASGQGTAASGQGTVASGQGTAGISGTIVAGGSSALQPLAQKAAELFMARNSAARIQVQGGGSGTGLTQVAQGGFQIGNSDIFAEEKLDAATASTLVDHKVCVVGFATVVNPQVSVSGLTSQQLVDIFTGKVVNWKDVGGQDQSIVIMQRPASSGTRATFRKYALGGKEEAQGSALTEDSSGTILKAVADTPGAISYLALSYVNSTVKALKLNGVEPSVASIVSGLYPIWAYEHMYTKGEATGLAKAFIDFITGAEFAPAIKELGYIPVTDMRVSR